MVFTSMGDIHVSNNLTKLLRQRKRHKKEASLPKKFLKKMIRSHG